MASQESAQPTAQVVGNAFVQQYYHILHQSPELVYRFYQEGSRLSRTDPHGEMTSITTTQAINGKIMSLDYSEFRPEIKTVDAQESLGGGVIVLVTGYLTWQDGVGRDFTQSFFLAPQDKGYFVLNDILRYVGAAADHPQAIQDSADDDLQAALSHDDSPPLQEQLPPEQAASPPEEEEAGEEEVYNPPENGGEVLDVEKEAPVEEVVNEVQITPPPVLADSSPVITHQEPQKKSYASIVKVMRENSAPMHVPAHSPVRPPPIYPDRQTAPAPASVAESEVLTPNNNAIETSSDQEAADGHSIYVKSLPLNATSAQLEEEFKKFGPIKPGGIQVRSNKIQGFCFGFVEFEVASAVQSAIEASPVIIGGRQAYVEEKRTAGTRVNNRGRFAPGRVGVFRNEGTRGRGSYSERGYARGDFSNRTDFGSRGRGRVGSSDRGSDSGYQRLDHLGSDSGYRRLDHLGSSGGRGNRSGSVHSPAS